MNVTDVLVDAIRHLAPRVYRMEVSAGYNYGDVGITLGDRPGFYKYQIYICPEHGRVTLFDHTTVTESVIARADLGDAESMGRLLDAVQHL